MAAYLRFSQLTKVVSSLLLRRMPGIEPGLLACQAGHQTPLLAEHLNSPPDSGVRMFPS